MIHLFIDTNIFLSFYRFSNEQLHKLEELVSLIRAKKVKLYLTEQVIDEFNRNREKVFKDTMKVINDFSPKFLVPVMCNDMKEVKSIQTQLKQIEKKKKKIEERLKRQFKYNSLKIDMFMKEIISSTNVYEVTEIIYNRGLRRYHLGNPPGKNNSYGDAINWEILLENVPKRQPLYFIGNDSDHLSPMDKAQFSDFLSQEWKRKKGSSVILFNSILEFLQKKNPASKITKAEVKKEKEINAFSNLYYANFQKIYNFNLNPLENFTMDSSLVEKITSLNNALSFARNNLLTPKPENDDEKNKK